VINYRRSLVVLSIDVTSDPENFFLNIKMLQCGKIKKRLKCDKKNVRHLSKLNKLNNAIFFILYYRLCLTMLHSPYVLNNAANDAVYH